MERNNKNTKASFARLKAYSKVLKSSGKSK